MSLLKRIGGFLGFLLFLTPCILAGIYTGNFSTSKLVAWVVGIGIAVVEIGLLVFLASLVDKKKEHIAWAALAVVLGLAPMAYWVGWPIYVLKPFQERVPAYLSLSSQAAQSQSVDLPAVAGDAPIKGKLIPIDVKKKKVDPLFFDLSDELRPKRPEDIGTLALLLCEENQIGRYGGAGGGAYQWECRVQVADGGTGAVLSEKSFTGSMPPSTSNNGATQSGDKPYKQIGEYLNGLPHR